jgi:hypothetical protein
MFEINKIYNFNTLAPVTLGLSYKNMKVIGANINYRLAVNYTDIYTTREKIIQETGLTLLNVKDVSYVIFENEYKETLVLSLDWVVTDSIVVVESINANIRLTNISNDDLTIINNAINALGYSCDITTD